MSKYMIEQRSPKSPAARKSTSELVPDANISAFIPVASYGVFGEGE